MFIKFYIFFEGKFWPCHQKALILNSNLMAMVAQLVEPRIVVPVVAGSSPVLRPNRKPDFLIGFFYVYNQLYKNITGS